MKKHTKIINKILRREGIYAVYQPIICLHSGQVTAYEALSRIDDKLTTQYNISEVFEMAKTHHKLWELEKLCRQKALAQAQAKPKGTKLFLNIDPDIIADSDFTAGFTKQKIAQYKIEPSEIIFELSEQSPITDPISFKKLMRHYQKQKFKIAIDDFGTGYSGMQRIQRVHPDFIKIDISLVREVDSNLINQAIIESLVSLSHRLEAELIAEGVETQAELKKLIELGVHYAQGYFVGRPHPEFVDAPKAVKDFIIQTNYTVNASTSLGEIEYLAQRQKTVLPSEQAGRIYDLLRKESDLSEYCIVEENEEVVGVITRKKILEYFSGQYGYNLHAKKPISEIMETTFLSVDVATTIEEVAKRAMRRPSEHVYDAVVVTRHNKYVGVVTIKTLLAATIEFQVKQAKDANPLTQMPGNNELKRQIHNRIVNAENFSLIYFDLDAFKAYNDKYGFDQGDRMIQALAKAIANNKEQRWFSGHIGGDDFVVIAENEKISEFCHQVFAQFEQEKQHLYSYGDWQRGFIEGKDRNGNESQVALATISAAVIMHHADMCEVTSVEELSTRLTAAKQQSKQQLGNSLVIV